jgi:hypothetical protein
VQVILDRALPHGGWNCGNKRVFGRELRPQPVPTALSLLAMAACGEQSGREAVDRGSNYLRHTIPSTSAGVSLGWSLLALRAHAAAPSEVGARLECAFAGSRGAPDVARSLALLLLASGEHALALLLPRGNKKWL